MLLHEKDNKKKFKKRIFYTSVFVVATFGIILCRLSCLQLIQGEKFKTLSENNRIRIRKIPHPRGVILDRKGTPLVRNYPSFNLSIIPEDILDLNEVIGNLSRLLDIKLECLIEKLNKSRAKTPFKPRRLKTGLDHTDVAIIETNKHDLPGVTIEVEPKRLYLFDNLAAHITGYTGRISKSQLKARAYAEYGPTDTVGKCGIEHEFESALRGRDGRRWVEVDAAGREIRLLNEVEPTPGNNVFLTIDSEIQRAVERALTGKKGCAIVMNPNNGAILALASSPSFNPNMFSRTISFKEWAALIADPHHPLQNKAIQGQYPPGSVYKIVTAIAGLKEGVITPETQLHCGGSYRFGGRNFRCWKKGGHGNIRLHRALVESCDVYFYQVGQALGIDRLASYSFKFGLGKPTTIPLLNEKSGLVPTGEWKLKTSGSHWQEGETLSVAIGQSFLLATPIQVLNLISSVANGGTLYRPQIIERIEAPDKEILREFTSEKLGTIPADGEVIDLITEALRGAVNDPNGSGWRARIAGVSVAGKTGTAQVVELPEAGSADGNTPPELRDHAWFAAFAPSDHPQVSVVVMIEHGGGGGRVAAPIARDIIKKALNIDAAHLTATRPLSSSR